MPTASPTILIKEKIFTLNKFLQATTRYDLIILTCLCNSGITKDNKFLAQNFDPMSPQGLRLDLELIYCLKW